MNTLKKEQENWIFQQKLCFSGGFTKKHLKTILNRKNYAADHQLPHKFPRVRLLKKHWTASMQQIYSEENDFNSRKRQSRRLVRKKRLKKSHQKDQRIGWNPKPCCPYRMFWCPYYPKQTPINLIDFGLAAMIAFENTPPWDSISRYYSQSTQNFVGKQITKRSWKINLGWKLEKAIYFFNMIIENNARSMRTARPQTKRDWKTWPKQLQRNFTAPTPSKKCQRNLH